MTQPGARGDAGAVWFDDPMDLQLAGKRNPYPGQVGVVKEGALADLLVIEGATETSLDWLQDPTNLRLIMKGGAVIKHTL